MWAFVLRKILYYIPVYLSIIFLVMLALRVKDPTLTQLSKNPSQQEIDAIRAEYGLDKPFIVQYFTFVGKVVTLNFEDESWRQGGKSVGEMLRESIPRSMWITVPTLGLSAFFGVCIAIVSAYFRGRTVDRGLMVVAVLGMSISYLVYIIFGQFFGAFYPRDAMGASDWPFSIDGYGPLFLGDDASPMNWVEFYMLPVIIGAVVALGYDTRFYRSVMVEETGRDYITTAIAKGASKRKVMFVHMLKNAMIPIITRIMATLPFLITGAVLVEIYFVIPGMGFQLIKGINDLDFPVIQGFVAVLAAIFIATIILTDVLYALVDPRVRLS